MREKKTFKAHRGKIVRFIAVLLSVALMSSFCGCGMFASLDLTEEESGLIAEYAAGLLKKYNKNGSRLMNPDYLTEPEQEQESPEEVPEETPEEETPAEEQDPANVPDGMTFDDLSAQEGEDEMGVEDMSGEDVVFSAGSIADCLGLNGISVTYLDYDVCDVYPDHPDDSWLISMSAREGKKLIVVRFDLTNDSDETQNCDILNAGKQYRLIVNKEKRINETVTVLMDSFSQFSASLEPGKSEKAVLIFELDSALCENVNSLDLVIRDSMGTETFQLF